MQYICKSRISFIALMVKRFIKSRYASPYQSCLKKSFFAVLFTCSLIMLIDSIVHGMHRETIAILKGVHADLRISLPESSHDKVKELLSVIQHALQDAHFSVAPLGIHYGLIYYAKKLLPITIIALPESPLSTAIPLEKWLVENNDDAPTPKSITTMIHGNKIGLGIDLASTLKCTPSDRLHLIFSGKLHGKSIDCQNCSVKCNAIIKSGIDEFDKQTVYIDAQAFENLTDTFPFTYILINSKKKLKPNTIKRLQKSIAEKTGLAVCTWRDTYPSLAHALQFEQICTFIMLVLLLLLSSITSYSLLMLFLSEKTKHLASLMLIGAPAYCITLITTIIGLLTLVCASSIGCAASIAIASICDHYQLITLPTAYCHTVLPLEIEILTPAILIAFHALIGVIAGLAASRRIISTTITATTKAYQ